MNTLEFNTEALPVSDRLPSFRRGASDFRVDAIGRPEAFSSRWRLLKLGDLNAIRASVSPIRYRRDLAMIEADGQDRIAIHCFVSGGSTGLLDGRPIDAGPGEAAVWDLSRPIDMRVEGPLEVLIVTLPRFLLEEVVSAPSYSCVLPASATLALATNQLQHMLDHASDLSDAAAPYVGRALRDLFAVAMLPVIGSGESGELASSPTFLRICRLIDAQPERRYDELTLSAELGVDQAEVAAATLQRGGLTKVVESRRLLAAYRRLCDPAQAAAVGTIAWQCGFSSTSLFNRRFRDVFQTTPTELRRFQRGSLPDWAGAYHVDREYGALAVG